MIRQLLEPIECAASEFRDPDAALEARETQSVDIRDIIRVRAYKTPRYAPPSVIARDHLRIYPIVPYQAVTPGAEVRLR